MIRCNRCGRRLTRPPVVIALGRYGPTCAQAITGAKQPRGRRAAKPDENQAELPLVEGQ